MKEMQLENMTTDQLISRYIEIGLAQYDVIDDMPSQYTRLYHKMRAIEDELKRRPGDERYALLVLHQHPNAQVRLNSGRATLALAPAQSRAALEQLVSAKEFPQALHAGMSLSNLNEGIYKPT